MELHDLLQRTQSREVGFLDSIVGELLQFFTVGQRAEVLHCCSIEIQFAQVGHLGERSKVIDGAVFQLKLGAPQVLKRREIRWSGSIDGDAGIARQSGKALKRRQGIPGVDLDLLEAGQSSHPFKVWAHGVAGQFKLD